MDEGILMPAGSSLRIPAGGLRLTSEGITVEQIEINVDLWPSWLRIAIEHERRAKRSNAQLAAIGPSDPQLHELVDEEMREGMVAIAAACLAVDAFHAGVRSRLKQPPNIRSGSKQGAIIAETLRRGFAMSEDSFLTIKKQIERAFEFRNWSIHPSGRFEAPVLHPLLKRGVAPAYVRFSHNNSQQVINLVMSLLRQLTDKARPQQDQLAGWAEGIAKQLDSLDALRNI